MKKFLSLVLALVMAMSLVTVSAGATEYKDFTDKDEIQYEEAVSVLNRLGIITGYSEGDFRPEGELTRGAAAKIIVSLLIGPEAAEALGNNSSPFPDVPAGNNFAGVISYCKTAKIIGGYSDGTFRPQGTLTGYAFAKMLLGALGYKTEYENFEGAGWNMNVARLGGEVGLFDHISFNGNATVNREQACQLALNTLKATMVEYSGGMNITAGDATIVANPTCNYKTSNQDYARHINNRKVTDNVDDDYYTVEFGEEHFVDLRMETERTNWDNFGRPSNVWSYKKVTIGTFPVEADFVYTTRLTHVDASNANKNRATGLGGYKVKTDDGDGNTIYTNVWVNGRLLNDGTSGVANFVDYKPNQAGTHNPNADSDTTRMTVENIADLTDNGTVVEVYVSDTVADFITDVVVVKTQLMEVRRVGSDYVALQKEDNKDVDDMVAGARAFNQEPIDVTVENIMSEDALYSVVSGLKAGDLVAVVPVAQDQDGPTKWDVGDVYVPETVTGALSAANYYGISGQGSNVKQGTTDVTVGGTKYNVALWARDLYDVDGEAVKVTRKDVTLYLDRNGNALKANDIGETSDWFIIGRYYKTMVNNRIVTIAEGWDSNGNEMELNLGTSYSSEATYRPGDLVRYKNSTSSTADWVLSEDRVVDVDAGELTGRDIKTSDVYIKLEDGIGDLYVHKNIKFIYVTFDDDDNEVESIEIKSGVQDVTLAELGYSYMDPEDGWNSAQAGYDVNDTTKAPDSVKVVVIKDESNDAIASNMMYIRTQIGGAVRDANGKMIYHYTAAKMSADGLQEEVDVYSDDQVDVNTFVAYTAKEHAEYSEFYDLRSHNNYTGRSTSTFQAQLGSVVNANNGLIRIAPDSSAKKDENNVSWATTTAVLGTQNDGGKLDAVPVVLTDPRNNDYTGLGGESRTIRIRNAKFLDLRSKTDIDNTREINSLDDFNWVMEHHLDRNGNAGTTANNGYLEAGETSLVMQLIVNDKKDANGFREVALVVITDEIGVTGATAETIPDTRKDTTGVTLTIGTKKYVGKEGEEVPVTVDSLTGLTGSYEITNSGTGTSITGTDKLSAWDKAASNDVSGNLTVINDAVAENATLTFVVTSEKGIGHTYTFKFSTAPAASSSWTWSGANKDDTLYSSLKNTPKEGATGNAEINPSRELIINWVDTGDDEDTKKQIIEAMEALGYENVVPFKETPSATSWTINASKTIDGQTVTVNPISLDETSATLFEVKVNSENNKVYVQAKPDGTNPAKVSEIRGLYGNVREKPLTGDPVDIESGGGANQTQSVTVNPGSLYFGEAFTVLTPISSITDGNSSNIAKDTDYSLVVNVDGKAPPANGHVDAGAEVTVVITALKDISNDAGLTGTISEATIAVVGTDNLTVSGIVVKDGAGKEYGEDEITISGNTITFVKTNAAHKILTEKSTITITYTVGTDRNCATTTDMTSSNTITYNKASI